MCCVKFQSGKAHFLLFLFSNKLMSFRPRREGGEGDRGAYRKAAGEGDKAAEAGAGSAPMEFRGGYGRGGKPAQ